MGNVEINGFLTFLAVKRKVAASTQNQTFSALLLLWTQVLQIPIQVVRFVPSGPSVCRSPCRSMKSAGS